MNAQIIVRFLRSLTCLLVAALIVAGSAVSAQAQFSGSAGMSVIATQDQATSVTSISYGVSHQQNWLNPNQGQNADLPTLVEFYSVQTGIVTVPISPTVYIISGVNYDGYTISGDWGAGFQFNVKLGSSAPSTPSISSTYHGGVLEGVMDTISGTTASLPTQPLFSAGTFNTFTSTSPTGTVAVDFSTFTVPGGAITSGRSFGLSHLVGGSNSTFANLIFQSTGAGITSFNLDTSLIVAGDSYNFFLTDSYTASDGVGYGANTNLIFTAIPEPSTYAAIAGFVALAGVMFHRRRRTV